MISTYMLIAVIALLIVGVITAYFVSDLGSAPVYKPKKAFTVREPMEELFCVGGPADGELIQIPVGRRVVEVPVPNNAPVSFYRPTDPPSVPDFVVVTYQRGRIRVPAHGVTYNFLHVDGGDEFAAGVEYLERNFFGLKEAT
jgi:hypothetical protein